MEITYLHTHLPLSAQDKTWNKMSLEHRTIFEDSKKVALKLPFSQRLQAVHPEGTFQLLKDPLKDEEAVIVGMFVLRPADEPAFTGPLIGDDGQPSGSVLEPNLNWIYNVDGFTGGWLIANFNGIDAYRLGMQYGVSDAVICSSNIVCTDGIDTETGPGYTWQPYNPLSWPSVTSIDPDMVEKVAETRELWQGMGYLSSRKYPAQIIYTWSGLKYDNSPDFLEGAVFSRKHPDGSDIEVYIITTELGASRIRERSSKYNLSDRIDKILIVVPPRPGKESPEGEMQSDMDITLIPKILYQNYNMKIVNHDGGQKILAQFCRHGVITQMNLTLGRQITVRQALQGMSHIPQDKKDIAFQNYFDRYAIYRFFSYYDAGNGDTGTEQDETREGTRQLLHGIPPSLPIVSIIEDPRDEICIYVFDTRGGFDFSAV